MWIIRKKDEYVFGILRSTESLNALLKKLSDDLKGKFVISSHYPPTFPFYIIEGHKGQDKKWTTSDNCPDDKALKDFDSANVYRIEKEYVAKPIGGDKMGELSHGHYEKGEADAWIKKEQAREPKEKFVEVSIRPAPAPIKKEKKPKKVKVPKITKEVGKLKSSTKKVSKTKKVKG